MKQRFHRTYTYISAIFVISLFAMFMFGCSSSGDSDDKNTGSTNPAETYTASGTYTYDANTGTLSATFTSTEFTSCGPELGTENINVSSISATTMVWDEGSEDEMTWMRDSGTAGVIAGTWDFEDGDGNDYEINIGDDGSLLVVGDIIVCFDDDNGDGDSGPGTGGDTSTWSITLVNDLDSVQTNTTCDLDATDSDTITINVIGSSFSFTTEDGNQFNGAIVGSLYNFYGTWTDNGVSYVVSGSFTMNPSGNSFSGTDLVTTNEGTDFCIWSQEISGTRQNT